VDAVRTSADGSFRLAAAPGSYVLRVRADDAPFLQEMHFTDQPSGWWTVAIPGHEPYFQKVDLPADARLTIDLDGSSQIDVEIVDAQGAPRASHMIALHSDDGRQTLAHTDAQGAVRFRNLPSGRYKLHTPNVTTRGSWGGGVLRDVDLGAASVEHVRLEV